MKLNLSDGTPHQVHEEALAGLGAVQTALIETLAAQGILSIEALQERLTPRVKDLEAAGKTAAAMIAVRLVEDVQARLALDPKRWPTQGNA